ncbi:hypothetical protein L7F22_028591 [Adiantum nelumboides]|nr:hypothetical protein [Adiantum nelumboides]
MMRVGKNIWAGEEELKLSKLLLAFWQRHGYLPNSGCASAGFWQTLKERLAHRFTVKQIQRKVGALRNRHLNIISGTVREVKKSEAETVPIWAKMIDYREEEEDEGNGAAGPVEAGQNIAKGVYGGAFAQLQPENNTHVLREPGERWILVSNDIKEEDSQEVYAGGNNMAEMMYEGMDDAAASWEDMAGADGAEEDSSSCCIIEEEDEPEEVEEEEEVNEGQKMKEAEGREHDQEVNEEAFQEEGQELDEEVEEEKNAAEQHNPAHNNNRGFRRKAASGLHADDDKQELRMLNRLTIADLASAVRTLAEVVRVRPPPIPV